MLTSLSSSRIDSPMNYNIILNIRQSESSIFFVHFQLEETSKIHVQGVLIFAQWTALQYPLNFSLFKMIELDF